MKIWWIRRDPCGLFSAGLSVALLLYSQYVMTTVIILPWYGAGLHLCLYTLCTALGLYCHTAAQFQDPGSVPASLSPPPLPTSPLLYAEANPPPPAPKVCRHCRTLKPVMAFHCSTCERCIVKMDHHCPWINNCVGINNQKVFILFLFYTALCCLYSGVLLVARFFSCSKRPRQCSVAGSGTALAIVDFVLCLVFGLFVVIMMFDQLSAIWEGNEEKLRVFNHQMQQREAQLRNGVAVGPPPQRPKMLSRYEAVVEVFGESLSPKWLLPLPRTAQVDADFDAELSHARARADNQIKAIHMHVQRQEQREAALQAANAQMRAAASSLVAAANAGAPDQNSGDAAAELAALKEGADSASVDPEVGDDDDDDDEEDNGADAPTAGGSSPRARAKSSKKTPQVSNAPASASKARGSGVGRGQRPSPAAASSAE